MGPGGLWWSNVLDSALPPQRLRPNPRPEHQDPASHMMGKKRKKKQKKEKKERKKKEKNPKKQNPKQMNRENPKTNDKKKTKQRKSHRETYTYALT